MDGEFWTRVDMSAGADACWPWRGRTAGKGYGQFMRDGRQVYAHRTALLGVDEKLVPLCVLHSCDNPICCNPRHLSLGTYADNNRDCRSKKRHAYGETHGRGKLSEAQAREIKRLLAAKMMGRAIAREFGVSFATVCDINRGRCWAHLEG